MPLRLNVGLARKVGEANYGSRGASVNVELEVDGSLVTEPDKLKERIRQLFSLVRTSLADELNCNGNGNGHGTKEGNNQQANGAGQTKETGQRPRAATQSQIKALYAITKSQGLNLNQLLRERFKTGKPEQLSIGEASQMIDELKSKQG